MGGSFNEAIVERAVGCVRCLMTNACQCKARAGDEATAATLCWGRARACDRGDEGDAYSGAKRERVTELEKEKGARPACELTREEQERERERKIERKGERKGQGEGVRGSETKCGGRGRERK